MGQSLNLRLGDLFKSRKEPGQSGLPILSVTMNDGLVHRDTLERKTNGDLAPEKHLLIRKGDIAYNMMRMWQGASGLAQQDGIVSPAYVVLAPNDNIDPVFASYWFKSARMIYLFWAYSYGMTGDRLRLYFKDFGKIPVTIPSKTEQERIGKVLVNWDQAVEKTKKLIGFKQESKKALVQKLISQKTNLNGFKKNWTKHELAKICSLSKKRFSPYSSHKIKPCIELENISQGDGRLIRTISSNDLKSTKTIFQSGDILFGKLRPNLRKYYLADFSGVCSNEIWVLQPNQALCVASYLFQMVQTEYFISAACVSSGSKMPRADWSYISRLPFTLPPLTEQKEIAKILSAADKEIYFLKEKLNALNKQKKSLMQHLMKI